MSTGAGHVFTMTRSMMVLVLSIRSVPVVIVDAAAGRPPGVRVAHAGMLFFGSHLTVWVVRVQRGQWRCKEEEETQTQQAAEAC